MPASCSISPGPDFPAAPAVERFVVTVAGSTLTGVLHFPAGHPAAGRAPCVIACHGMGASKDSDKYLLLGEALPRAGLALARFDFRGSGESGGSWRDATVATRIADLEAVLDHLKAHPRLDGRFGVLGSSLGGFVALWVAARRGPLPVVTWNAPARLLDLEEQEVSETTGLGPALVTEVMERRFAEVPAGATRALVVQGASDEVVPPAHGRLVFDRVGEPRALHVIAGADHRLSDPAHRREALDVSRRWLTHHLLEDPS
jgi:hypothetical protein